jgi:hypothetical protein
MQQQKENDDEELDVDISQRLQELQGHNKGSSNKQQHRVQQQEEMDDEGEQEDEEDEEMLIDLDQLDDHNRQMLLEYLQ